MLWKRTLLFAAFLFSTMILCVGASELMAQGSKSTTGGDTWKDNATGLTWTVKDNGSSVSPNQASDYCSSLRAGGFSDWRVPTVDELEAVYDAKSTKQSRIKGPIQLGDPCVLSGTTNSSGTWTFCFNSGSRNLGGGSGCGTTGRVLCTRGPEAK